MTRLGEKDNRKKKKKKESKTNGNLFLPFGFQKANSDTEGSRTLCYPFYHINYAKTQKVDVKQSSKENK